MANGTSTLTLDRTQVFPLIAVAVVVVAASTIKAESFSMIVFGVMGMLLILARPEWGVATLLAMLMMQYRNQSFWLSQMLPSGEGLLSINNVLGIFLAMVMAYRLYRDADWSFLRSRQVQLVGAILLAVVVSALLHPLDYGALRDIGLRPPNQDPVRLLVSRGLFVVLVVFFLKFPREIRLLVAIFLALSIISAVSASVGALSGQGWEGGVGARVQETYRAGGSAVFARIVGNPNRLAMIATLSLIFLWEWGQSARGRRYFWVGAVIILGLILTVFLTASRGGMVGLLFTGLLIVAHRTNEARRLVYAAMLLLIAGAVVTQIVPEETWERLTNVPVLNQDADSRGTGSVERRGYTLGIALELSKRDPVFGIGVGNWELQRFLIDPVRSVSVPHNSYLMTVVESGIVTLVLFLLLFRVTIRQLRELEADPSVMAQAGTDGLDWLISGTRLALLSFLVFSLFSDLWETVNLYVLLGTAGALIARYGGRPTAAQPV
jgi:O-antigen ligase